MHLVVEQDEDDDIWLQMVDYGNTPGAFKVCFHGYDLYCSNL